MLNKQAEKIFILGALEHTNKPKWVALSFSQPKLNTNWVLFMINIKSKYKVET